MKVNIILTQIQYNKIHCSLLPADDPNEHFGFGIAGVSFYKGGCNLLLRDFIPADSSCLLVQTGASVRPKPGFIDYIWTLAKKSNSCLIDFHTHPFCDAGVSFSSIDNDSESKSFPMLVEFLGDGPHASIVLGRNSLDARWYNPETTILEPISLVKVIGEKLEFIVPTSSLRGGAVARVNI